MKSGPDPAIRRTFVGQSVPRLEDLPLVLGRGRYAAGISFPHELHMRVVRSNHAHGRIVGIDTRAALRTRGCVAVWTASDVADLPPIEFRPTRVQGLEPYRQPVLAKDRVRYVGEPLAVVFADDAYRAEDAADLVTVEIEALPVVLDASAPPREFEPGRSTEAAVIRKQYGDIDAAFRAAHAVIELDLAIGRHSGVPLETRGAIARYDATRDVLELHGAAKRPHPNRDLLARMLGRSLSSVHLYECHIGGGFGVRGEIYPEDVLVCAAALRLGRPVKWIEDRRENLMACNHSREQRHRVRAAVAADGRVLAIDDEFFHDQGAYVRTHGARVADMTAGMLPGPYRIPAYRAAGHYRLTNKTPAATYRAPGRYESTFVCERIMDAVAAKLGLDAIEVRRRNLIGREEMPYARAMDVLDTELVLDSGDYARLLDKALARIGWDALQEELKRRRSKGAAVGAGIALFVEKSGLGPVDGVRVSVGVTGIVEVVTGSASVGQGMETVIAQICADALGVDYSNVRVIHGRTDAIEFGFGAHASRVTVMTGSATRIAALKVRAQALEIAAAHLIEATPDMLDIVDGRIIRTDRPDGASVSLAEVARALVPAAAAAKKRAPGLSAEGWFEAEHMTYPYGVHVAVVKVDRDTGGLEVERYLAAFDIGRAVNPMLVEGQIAGGFVQGLGGALLEEFAYDENGSPICVTFADYLLPTIGEVPDVDVLVTEDAPSPLNPLGLKGAGEGGINAVGAAVASAIDDAIGVPGAVTRLPVTPQRLKKLLRDPPRRPAHESRKNS
ncbi:MAG TPA: xanthine dehydrogenase family protein molybdopterin-binding subunit [Burkholderiales bacterium]|nr:xanthine dehydrogenase family protein molybdopterin-binding subunit [Burkholderiales bacterium]